MTAEIWTSAPTVFIQAPPRARCPHCGTSEQPIIVRCQDQGDGSSLRRCICRQCSRRFKICVEPLPTVGSEVWWPE